MELDLELVYGTEDYEDIQEYFEHRKLDYPSGSQRMSDRLRNEYIPDIWELEEYEETDKISNRREAIRRILELLEEVPPNSKDVCFKKAQVKK